MMFMPQEERLCLTDEMLGVLASLKGKTLKSYEARLLGKDRDCAFQVVVLNTGSVRVPVVRFEKGRELFGEVDDYSPFECFALDAGAPYRYTLEAVSRLYLVGERVRSVEVVRDSATWRDEGEELLLHEDKAIVVRTSGHALGLIARHWYFDNIDVRFADSPDADLVPPVTDFWDMDYCERVEREIIVL